MNNETYIDMLEFELEEIKNDDSLDYDYMLYLIEEKEKALLDFKNSISGKAE